MFLLNSLDIIIIVVVVAAAAVANGAFLFSHASPLVRRAIVYAHLDAITCSIAFVARLDFRG